MGCSDPARFQRVGRPPPSPAQPDPERQVRATTALDPQQRVAVETAAGPLLILAGAGSGKTRVLTRRAGRLVQDGEPADELLAITFTNRAARELTARLTGLIGSAANRMTVGTFHAVCHRMLRDDPERAGRRRGFSIYDAQQTRRLVTRALAQSAATTLEPTVVALQIGQAKARLLSPDRYQGLRDSPATRAVAHTWRLYQHELERSNAVDFDDLLCLAVALLGQPDLAARYQRRWRHILVDEYQDTNPAQHEWIMRLAGPAGRVTAVADEDQAIYGFRGAEAANLAAFERDLPGARVVALESNYRSSPQVVAAANRLIAHNARRHPKAMRATTVSGPAVAVAVHDGELAEARAAAGWCRSLIDQGVGAGEIAVLVRTRAQLRPLEDALLLGGLPHRTVGGQGLWESEAVRDLVAHLTLLCNPHDRLALVRALATRPGVGPQTIARVAGAARGSDLVAACNAAPRIDGLSRSQASAVEAFGRTLKELTRRQSERGVGETVVRAVVDCGLAARLAARGDKRSREQLEGLRRLCRSGRRYERQAAQPTLSDLLAQAALASGDAVPDKGRSAVSVSTLHLAKGCEWDHVLIVGLCEGLLPHRRTLAREEIDEDRRLAYVGFTRARRELRLSWARTRHGERVEPSRFLAEAGLSVEGRATATDRRAA